MSLRDRLDDGKAQPRATRFTAMASSRIGAVESLEHRRGLDLAKPRPTILHGEHHRAILLNDRNLDASTSRRKLERVVHEVPCHLTQQAGIKHGHRSFVSVNLERDAFRHRSRAQPFGDTEDHGGRVGGFQAWMHRPGVRACKGEQILGDRGESHHLFERGSQHTAVFVLITITPQRDFDLAPHGGERRP